MWAVGTGANSMTMYSDIQQDGDPKRIAARFEAYRTYLKAVSPYLPAETADFVLSNWYYSDWEKCPHDAWLESLEITELYSGQRKENREIHIRIRLLAASHRGHIHFDYADVSSYVLDAARIIARGDTKHDFFMTRTPLKRASYRLRRDLLRKRRRGCGGRGAGAPRRRPSVLRSSSMSGQWIPYPPPPIFQWARCAAVACRRRGYHARGTEIERPSIRLTVKESSEKATFATLSSAATTEVLIPCLQQFPSVSFDCR